MGSGTLGPAYAALRSAATDPQTLAPRLPAAEGVEIEPDALEVLSRVSGGDLRKAITTLQSTVRLRGERVTADGVLDVSGTVPRSAVEGLLVAARSGLFAKVQAAVAGLIAEGYPVSEAGVTVWA